MFFDSVSCFAVDGQGSHLAGAYGQSDAQRQRHRTGRRWLSQIEDRLLLSVPAGLLRSGRSRQSAALLLGADLRCWHAGAWTQPSLSPGGGGVSRTFEAARATCSAIRCLPVAPDAGARPHTPPAPAAPRRRSRLHHAPLRSPLRSSDRPTSRRRAGVCKDQGLWGGVPSLLHKPSRGVGCVLRSQTPGSRASHTPSRRAVLLLASHPSGPALI